MTSSANGIRTVEHKGGIDNFLLDTAPTKLTPALRKVRKQLLLKVGAKDPAPKMTRYPKAKPKVKKSA